MSRSLKQVLFIVLVAGQLGSLGWFVHSRGELVKSGEKIRLECQPIDPRSLLSGDYVILNYQISEFDEPKLKPLVREGEVFKLNAPVWVELEKTGGGEFHKATGVSSVRGNLDGGGVVIRGSVKSYRSGGRLRIRYGLEQYFVPQYEGKNIEAKLRDASVEVAVNSKGDCAVTRIFISGEEVEFH